MGKIGPIGIPELLIILLVVLLIFGPRRLPDMAKGLGQSVREFRKGLRDMRKDFEDEASAEDGAAKAAAPVQASTAHAATDTTVPARAPAAGTPATGTGSTTDAAHQGTDPQTER